MKAIQALAAAALVLGARAQEMSVVGLDGGVQSFALTAIDSLTFHETALRTAGDLLRVHGPAGTTAFAVAGVDSVCFADGTTMSVHLAAGSSQLFDLALVDSLTFAELAPVTVVWSGASATVDNPLADLGVTVAVDGGDVVVTAASGLAGVVYDLSGSGGDGMFKIYSDADFGLRLDGLALVNGDGPAINVQADETIAVELVEGTTTTLTDGASYADPPGDEDQKAAFFSEGQLVFSGGGALVIHGQGDDRHGLGSDDYIVVESGQITVAGAAKDGVHTNEGFFQAGGVVDVTGGSDGVDAGDGPVVVSGGERTVLIEDDDRDALKCDGQLTISGGAVDLTVAGDQSKGLNAVEVHLLGGETTIHATGGVVLEPLGSGYDPSYCTAVKADELVQVDGGQLTITATGQAGRGVSCDGGIEILAGSVTVTSSGGGGVYTNESGVQDAFHGPCLNADADIAILGGAVTLHHVGSGGKGVAGDASLTIGGELSSPTLQVTTTGSPISIGGGEYAEAKAISIDSLIVIANGELTIDSADDAIKSKTRIDVDGGLIEIVDSLEGLEAPEIHLNGGEIHLTSTDDGINATHGVDGEFNDGSVLQFNGSYVHLNAPAGDGVDSNGNCHVNGGTLIIHGPPNQPEVGLDVNGTFRVDGGALVVAQINGMMVETPSSSSTQRCVLARRTQNLTGGTLFHVEDAAGNSLLTFTPARTYSCVLFSLPAIASGTTYRIYTGGSCTGTPTDGLYDGGVYSGGTLRATFTSSSMVQTVNF